MPIEIPLAAQRNSAAVRGPSVPTPVRRANSVRRTSTIAMTWLRDIRTSVHCVGRCRDLLTRSSLSDVEVIDEAEVVADLSPLPG